MDHIDTPKFNRGSDPHVTIDAFDAPALLMQANPRQVVTANKKACELFGKSLKQIEGLEVVNSLTAFTLFQMKVVA